MKRIAFIVLLGMPPLLLTGCMWGRVRTNDPSIRARALNVVPNETRVEQLQDLLGGEPTMRMPLKDRTVLSYTYADTKSNGLMLILFNFMKTQTVADTVYIEADAQGVVRSVFVPPPHEISWEFWPF